jgi:DNA polymerase/3'-5' exonuclease PolX
MTDFKPAIIAMLKEQLELVRVDGATFRIKAYRKVLDGIAAIKGPIRNIADLSEVPGIGKGIREKLDAVFSGNTVISQAEAEDARELMDVYGIGAVKARELFAKGITNVAKLLEAYSRNPAILNDKQAIGLRYYNDLLQRIPRTEMDKHSGFITGLIKRVDRDSTLVYEVTGSYRRGAKNSGDIDVLITDKSGAETSKIFWTVIEELEKSDYVVETLAKGKKKFMGICKLGDINRRLDMVYTTREHYPFALLYFTGSAEFNVEMRNLALSRGLSLNEYGFTDIKTRQPIKHAFKTEEDVFKYLDIAYIEPRARIAGAIKK